MTKLNDEPATRREFCIIEVYPHPDPAVNLPGISSTQCADNGCTQNALKTRQNNAATQKDLIESRNLEESLREWLTLPTEYAGTQLNVRA